MSRLLDSVSPDNYSIGRVTVWGSRNTLSVLPSKNWLKIVTSPVLNAFMPARMAWQQFVLPGQLQTESVDVLFSPGGTIPGLSSIPVVTMSQNMLPFEPQEASRYALISPFRFKLSALKIAQTYSMRNADGVIFLSRYASERLLGLIPGVKGKVVIIPHGIEERFFAEPRLAKSITEYSEARPLRIIYVSAIDNYKHQLGAAAAVADLRRKGLPLELELVGYPLRSSYVKQLRVLMLRLDPERRFLRYSGNTEFEKLHNTYRQADLFLFASTCENLPNILLEAMASGLPIACSDRGPMPEVLGSAGVYFNPESSIETSSAILKLVSSPELREKMSQEAYLRAKDYSWTKCAADTFSFIAGLSQTISNHR